MTVTRAPVAAPSGFALKNPPKVVFREVSIDDPSWRMPDNVTFRSVMTNSSFKVRSIGTLSKKNSVPKS